MNESRRKPIVDQDGLEGYLEIDLYTKQDNVLAKFTDGKCVLLPVQLLVTRREGGYYLPLSVASLPDAEDSETAPLASDAVRLVSMTEDTLEIRQLDVPLETVRLTKSIVEEQVTLDHQLFEEQVNVEHVPVNRYLDAPADIRYEGDKIIVPVMEEVLVVQKRLYLREELHITKRQTEKQQPQQHTLRRERLHVEPFANDSELP